MKVIVFNILEAVDFGVVQLYSKVSLIFSLLFNIRNTSVQCNDIQVKLTCFLTKVANC